MADTTGTEAGAAGASAGPTAKAVKPKKRGLLRRLIPKSWKWRTILGSVSIVALIVGYQLFGFWWNRGYSEGTRTGVLRKLSRKGSPVCRYWAGEMSLVQAGSTFANQETFEFTLDSTKADDPVVKKLNELMRAAKPITVHYRQDKGRPYWWECAPTEYYVESVEPAQP
jgi:hypothetical protein